jgi:hypothetical protein
MSNVWLVNPDGTSKFTGSGLIPNSKRNSTGSAKCDAYLWMKDNYIDKGLCDCTHADITSITIGFKNPLPQS